MLKGQHINAMVAWSTRVSESISEQSRYESTAADTLLLYYCHYLVTEGQGD